MWRESALLAASMCLEFATAAACEGKTSCKYMNTVFVSPPFKPSLCSALLVPRMYGDISWTSVTLSSGNWPAPLGAACKKPADALEPLCGQRALSATHPLRRSPR